MIQRFWFPAVALLTLMGACAPGGGGPPIPPTPQLRLEGAVGTYVQQKFLNAPEARLGTALSLVLRQVDALPSVAAAIEVQGPPGWNRGEVWSLAYPAGAEWIVQPLFVAAPVAGVYTVTATLGEQRTQARFTLGEAGATLPLVQAQGERRSGGVALSWPALAGASGYFAQLTDATDDVVLAEGYTTTASLLLSVPVLNPAHSHYAVLYAANFDTTAGAPIWPTQLKVSDSLVGLSLNSLNQPQVRWERDGRWVRHSRER